MLAKVLTVLTVGLAATVAILQADSVNALHPHHALARRSLSAKGPDVHGQHPLHHHKARHERKKPVYAKRGPAGSRRLGESDYHGYDDSSSDDYGRHYGHGYGRHHGYGRRHGYGDSYDDSDYGDSYDDASYGDSYDDSDYGYGPSSYGYGGWYGSGYGGGFGGYPPFLYNSFESSASPVGSGPIPGGVTPESTSTGAAAAASKSTTTEAKKSADKKSAKPTAGAK